jgi:hypothetical protein
MYQPAELQIPNPQPLAVRVLATSAWYLYALLVTVLTLGIFPRFHLVTVRRRSMGGVRAGTYGGQHVYREDLPNGSFLVVSSLLGKRRYPVSQISYAETGVFKVIVDTSGSRHGRKLNTWQTSAVSEFVNAQVAQ